MTDSKNSELFQSADERAPEAKHACRSYFAIYGSESPEELCRQLSLNAADYEISDDRIRIGYNDTYLVDINQMIRITLKNLFGKEEKLAELKIRYSLEYYLALVPEIAAGSEEPNQILSIDEDIIAFLHLSKTKLDLDYYVI